MRKKLLTIAVTALAQLCWGQTNVDVSQTGPDERILYQLGIKTNLLYDATTSMNLGFEFRTGDKTSFDLPVSFNPWTFSNNKKWKHWLVQPEFRFWTDETFNGHFFGLHGHYAFYNVSRLDHPPFTEYMNNHRFEGWLAGGGISYGYRWNFNHRWGLEATVGAGYAYLSYDKFSCGDCERMVGSETKNYFGPTKAGLSLVLNLGAKNKLYKPTRYVPPPATGKPNLTIYFIRPEVEELKARSSEVGKAYLEFIVARSDILPNFRNNAAELERIHNLIWQVVNDPDATITGINITGYASPEASWSSNMALSQRRATSFKEHIRTTYRFSDSQFTVRGAGEDWATLEDLVSQSNMTDKYRIMDIIRSREDYDVKERRFSTLSGGRTYRQMMDEMYPKLRRIECQVHYTVDAFTVEKGKEVFRTRPNNLSLNEMFHIANTYATGSKEFNEVFETAARIFPQSDVANLNAAANALNRKDVEAAARYLDKVKERNVYYWNSLGVLSWMQRNSEKALDCFTKAGSLGAKNYNELNRLR